MKFGFIVKHRSVWPVAWLCEALGVSRSGFHAWLHRGPSARTIVDEELTTKVRTSFIASARTYGARRVWRDVLADGASCAATPAAQGWAGSCPRTIAQKQKGPPAVLQTDTFLAR